MLLQKITGFFYARCLERSFTYFTQQPVFRKRFEPIDEQKIVRLIATTFREERIIVRKIAATFREERIIARKFTVNYRATRIIF